MTITRLRTVVVEIRRLPQPPEPALGCLVVPIDGSDLSLSALIPARRLAERTGASIRLLTTVDDPNDETSPGRHLGEFAASFGDVETSTIVRKERDPVDAIIAEVADAPQPAWVVMASHGRGRLRSTALGSVAEGVVGRWRAPVLVVGPAYDKDVHDPDGPVVIAHDGVHGPDVDLTMALCAAASSPAAVLEVVAPFPEPPRPPESELEVSPSVARWASDLDDRGVTARCRVLLGMAPHKRLAEAAEELGASALVVATRANRPVTRAVLGSHAADIVRRSPVPVLIHPSREVPTRQEPTHQVVLTGEGHQDEQPAIDPEDESPTGAGS